MPDTYGGAISRGISQGLGNVSAMYGLQNQLQKSQREQELYDIQMKEYQRGQEPADWGKVEDFLDAGEYGKNYVQSYAGALGMDPAKMTRREMKEFGQIFLKDQKAAHDLLTLRRRHYGEKVKEYEGKPEFTSELKLFKQKFDESTLLDKEYRAAENYKKNAQTMQEIAQMTDEQLTARGFVPAIRTIAQSGDVETFGEIMKEVVKAQVKPPTPQMKVVPDSASATGYSYRDVSGGGVPAPAPGGKAGEKTYQLQIEDLLKQHPNLSKQEATGVILGTIKVQPDPVSGTLYVTDTIKGTQRPLTDTGLSSAPTTIGPDKSPTIWDLSSESTGPISSALTAASIATGTVGLPVAKKTLYARQYVQGAQNDLIRSLSINPRFPVGEINRLKEEINLAPSFFDNPQMLRQRILAIDAYLRKRVQNEMAASQNSTLSTEARRNARSAANDILNFLDILGAPTAGSSVSADDAALINKYLKR